MNQAPKTFFYKKSNFVTHLPMDYRYTRSHFWVQKLPDDRLRCGFTKFATRMLGEIVDYNFETPTQAPVQPGQILGWVEGFKAISDVICVGQGHFAGGNPTLQQDTELIARAPYTDGWLYEIIGKPDAENLDVEEYANHLNATIERLLEKQKADEQRSLPGEADTPP
jgi:glycine cleavage system H protein